MKTTARFLVLLAACAGCIPALGQQAKNPVQLGDQYFAAGEYYTAANLYGQYLKPTGKQQTSTGFPLNIKGKRSIVSGSTSRSDIQYKQAESYRLANYWQEAAASYKECAEKDPSNHSDALYWYAVCQRSLGQYAAAEEALNQYLGMQGDGNHFNDAAQKELLTLAYIRQQLSRADSILIKTYKLDIPNSSEKGAFAPVHVGGNQFLISSTEADSIKVNGMNPNHSRLFYATLNNGKIETMSPMPIAAEASHHVGAAGISADGKHLYFSQWRKEKGQTVSSIYHSAKQDAGWSAPTLVSSVNIPGFNSKQPFCSSDGKFLFFASDRPGGAGSFDIWYAALNSDGTTAEPVNAGTQVNTTADEQAPYYHNSSTTLVFSSNGRLGMGGYDLYSAKGEGTSWKAPENLGHPVNSSRDDVYFLAKENSPLLSNAIFSSDRGAGCCLETYSVKKTAKNKHVSGILMDCKDNVPVTGAEVSLKDPLGKTWKTTTGTDGQYTFELGPTDSYQQWQLTINRVLYNESVSYLTVESTDETDLLTDKLRNADVCMEKTPEETPEEVLVIKAEDVVTVFFEFDKSELVGTALSKLDSIYTMMMDNPQITVQISGYTDGRGTEEYNKVLSEKRAKACAAYLTQKGIDSTRLRLVSFGACCPIEMELIDGRDNPDGRSRNRRALINVKKD
ncbi:MAG: OmpA family protein [Chitinophagaceae bacterium]|nr:OmpA family protein [Chitinophagaceae bacterium]